MKLQRWRPDVARHHALGQSVDFLGNVVSDARVLPLSPWDPLLLHALMWPYTPSKQLALASPCGQAALRRPLTPPTPRHLETPRNFHSTTPRAQSLYTDEG